MNLIADSRFRLVFQCQETSLWQISRSPLQEPKINPTFIIFLKYRSKCSIKTELNNRSFIVIIRILNPFKAKPPIGSSFPQDFSLIFRLKKNSVEKRWNALNCWIITYFVHIRTCLLFISDVDERRKKMIGTLPIFIVVLFDYRSLFFFSFSFVRSGPLATPRDSQRRRRRIVGAEAIDSDVDSLTWMRGRTHSFGSTCSSFVFIFALFSFVLLTKKKFTVGRVPNMNSRRLFFWTSKRGRAINWKGIRKTKREGRRKAARIVLSYAFWCSFTNEARRRGRRPHEWRRRRRSMNGPNGDPKASALPTGVQRVASAFRVASSRPSTSNELR